MKVFIALGSNLGNRLAHLRNTVNELRRPSKTPIRKSAIYETEPVDSPKGSPRFLNAVVELEVNAGLSPRELLRFLKRIEAKGGRKPKQEHNEPRPIDLDLICFGDRKLETVDLTLPHPRAHKRRFVLQPLSDIAPNLILPGQTRTVRQLLNALAADESVVTWAADW